MLLDSYLWSPFNFIFDLSAFEYPQYPERNLQKNRTDSREEAEKMNFFGAILQPVVNHVIPAQLQISCLGELISFEALTDN